MDNKGQASAEFILLFGGIMVVVLLVIYMYNNYVSIKINGGEVKLPLNYLSSIFLIF